MKKRNFHRFIQLHQIGKVFNFNSSWFSNLLFYNCIKISAVTHRFRFFWLQDYLSFVRTDPSFSVLYPNPDLPNQDHCC